METKYDKSLYIYIYKLDVVTENINAPTQI